jgi:hypothetical protein
MMDSKVLEAGNELNNGHATSHEMFEMTREIAREQNISRKEFEAVQDGLLALFGEIISAFIKENICAKELSTGARYLFSSCYMLASKRPSQTSISILLSFYFCFWLQTEFLQGI